jgi:ADP-ribose pyrophosphatase YjhB (NUDIX family)
LDDLKFLWRGKIPTNDVNWTFLEQELILPKELESIKDEIWLETTRNHPEIYNGRVLTLDKFQTNNETMQFSLSFMRFSSTLTLARIKRHPPCLGSLGFQAIIFSRDKMHVLAGTRCEETHYCPLFYSVPGGILETLDTAGDFDSACLREISEETSVNLMPSRNIVALVPELHGTAGAVAIISGVAKGSYDISEKMPGNNEWLNQELRWYNVDELERFSSDNSLEGLLFVKSERSSFLRVSSSVLWP